MLFYAVTVNFNLDLRKYLRTGFFFELYAFIILTSTLVLGFFRGKILRTRFCDYLTRIICLLMKFESSHNDV